MKKLIILVSFAAICCYSCQDKNPADYVNPFIGTGGHGHTYPGATVPFGMVQLSPDTRLEGWDGCSGYHYSDSIIYGFSHTHLSGTGIPDYCDILLMPTTEKFYLNPHGCRTPARMKMLFIMSSWALAKRRWHMASSAESDQKASIAQPERRWIYSRHLRRRSFTSFRMTVTIFSY